MNGPDGEFEKRLLATFREEAAEHLGIMVDLLLELEKSGSAVDPVIVERIYRTTHSLKGAARAVNQKEIESVCQNLENVFSRIKKGTFIPDADAFDIFHQAVKVAKAFLDGENPTGLSPVAIGSAIRSLMGKDPAACSSGSVEPVPVSVPSAPLMPQSSGTVPSEDSFFFPRDDLKNILYNAFPKDTSGPDIAPIPLTAISGRSSPDGGTVRIAAHKLDRLIAGSDDLLTTRLFITQRTRELEDMMARFILWRWNQALISSDLYLIRETSFGARKITLPPELVLPLQRLVEYLDYDREFVTFLQHDLAVHIRATERDRSALEASTLEIADLIHDAVLLPVSSILAPFPGFVREYSRTTGKQVEFLTEGDEIEVDRRILDALKDPFMHLIHNSIDHGIEYPDIRTARGKPAKGRVRIRVFAQSGSKVGIEVCDDGAGIDCRKIREAAVRTGVISAKEEAGLSDVEAIWLIFRSGLSTSEVVTEISGRGLGLAIVEDTVTRLGGYVTLSSEVGRGTCITIRVPVRLVTFRGVVVRSGSQMYVLPMQLVRQVLRVKPDTIIMQGTRPAVQVNEEMISVLRLSDMLGAKHPGTPPATDAPVSLVIIAYGAGQVACLVDEVIRVQEIVVRPLGSQLRRVKRIAGAAILGDGNIALVLDPPDLIQESLKATTTVPPLASTITVPPRIMVVEDSVTSRTFLQMLLERDGYYVQTAVDGIQALAMLKEHEFDIVVSDIDMPRMSGFTLTEKIRADNRLSKLPVVLVTSLDAPEDRNHGIAVGADAFVVKSSFEKENLLMIIKDLARTGRITR
jgi:two-component system, chemotaxis family, sensor kinase CheA